jgi:hypothetical protein
MGVVPSAPRLRLLVSGQDIHDAARCNPSTGDMPARDPFAAVIPCTADPAKADKRTRSKWSRLMRYAAAYKPDSEALDQFIQRKGQGDRAKKFVTNR